MCAGFKKYTIKDVVLYITSLTCVFHSALLCCSGFSVQLHCCHTHTFTAYREALPVCFQVNSCLVSCVMGIKYHYLVNCLRDPSIAHSASNHVKYFLIISLQRLAFLPDCSKFIKGHPCSILCDDLADGHYSLSLTNAFCGNMC